MHPQNQLAHLNRLKEKFQFPNLWIRKSHDPRSDPGRLQRTTSRRLVASSRRRCASSWSLLSRSPAPPRLACGPFSLRLGSRYSVDSPLRSSFSEFVSPPQFLPVGQSQVRRSTFCSLSIIHSPPFRTDYSYRIVLAHGNGSTQTFC